jgi:hypothetical protein
LEIDYKPLGRQTGHDGIVGFDAVLVASGFEGLLEDEVAIRMVCNHDILVARSSLDGEPTSVIRVEFADGQDMDEELIGRRRWGGGWRSVGNGGLGLGGPDVLALLGQVTHDGLIRVGTVACCIGVGEAFEGLAVACLYCIKPCLLDWKA